MISLPSVRMGAYSYHVFGPERNIRSPLLRKGSKFGPDTEFVEKEFLGKYVPTTTVLSSRAT